ncbi:MAG: hypothetical protein K2M70_12450, partial [Lachnospiraceae bacterium]|nr:hypothetical protein [Lachnospiraceae bacterium]
CLIRGLISWPGAATVLRGKTLKIWEEEPADAASFAAQTESKEPGVVLAVEKDAFYVQTGSGALKVTEVQPEGKRRMAVKDFLLGYPIKAGEMFTAFAPQ